MGNEVIPDILDHAPRYPLDLTYKTIRTFPGMRLTADMTRFKPMLKWPAQPDSLYTIVLSNLDINSRRNRTLSEFWHWFVANIPGDSVEDGEVTFATTTFPQYVSSLGHFRSSLPTYSSRG